MNVKLHEAQIHRTLVQFLIESNLKELAAITLDGEVEVWLDDNRDYYSVALDLPPSGYNFILMDESSKTALTESIYEVLKGRMNQNCDLNIRIKLLPIEESWQDKIRDLLSEAQSPNQGSITERVFAKHDRHYLEYNHIKYASKSEIRIAQEFERLKVMFFPLALAVRNDTGNTYKDHREVDFLVCNDGQWGIIEVSYHPNRFEKDAEKDGWFKKSGILCIQHYTAERCYNHPTEVVKEFLEVLSKHRR